jgi:hypothetical protein
MALLADRSTPQEAGGYAAWVMDMAKAAAVARRHKDSMFAAPGPIVDTEERDTLREIADALGVSVGELPSEGVTFAAGPGIPADPINPS